jgi:hypothetical protein
VLEQPVDGTGAEVEALSTLAAKSRLRSMLYVRRVRRVGAAAALALVGSRLRG